MQHVHASCRDIEDKVPSSYQTVRHELNSVVKFFATNMH